MIYATQQDLQQRFGVAELIALSDIGMPATGGVVWETIDRALHDASAEIDGYLASRHVLPLPTVPALLTVFCCDIARYRLMSVRADDRVVAAYKAAVLYLRDVARGAINLFPVDSAPPAASGAGGGVTFDPGTKVWGRGRGGRHSDGSGCWPGDW